MRQEPAFDLNCNYVQLRGARAVRVSVGDDFWARMPERAELRDGWLVGVTRQAADWLAWEMHSTGDEIVYLLSGAVDFILEEAAGERNVPLRPGIACFVPRGVWHRAIVREPGDMMFMTHGARTQHRPV